MIDECFIRTTLHDKVKLVPRDLNMSLSETLKFHLQKKFEGKCSYHGYIKPYSIEIISYGLGKAIPISLNGDMEFVIKYKATVCNPAIGSIVAAQVTKSNKFGHFAQVYTTITIPLRNGKSKKKDIPILEVIIIKNAQNQNEYFEEKQQIHVEIMGKKFKINERTISAWGKYVHASQVKTVLDKNEMRMEYTLIPSDTLELDGDTQSSVKDSDAESERNDEEESVLDDKSEIGDDEEDEQDEVKEEEDPEGPDDPEPDMPSEPEGEDYDDLE